ncbi:MAG TPA: TonB-dependent receptor [Candidatus Cybelea sp.]|jgi:vitamin B12 transporter|nr:TonB-dependent receptor [Candidatus Cybelea sp.]
MFPLIVAAIAASPTPSPSPTAVPEIAHVVTSDRGLESAARAARTTYVVTAAQIARDGDRTVADAIEAIPGVNVVRYGAFGAAAAVGIRGSSSQQVLVLVDGLPAAGTQINDVNLEDFSVSGIDRIEVVEGGGSTLYGAGSIGGVINIITAAKLQRSTATLSTGSFGEQTYALTTPYLSFARTYATNDYSVVNAPNRQNAQAGLTTVAARYGRAVGALDLTLTGNLDNAQAGAPGSLGFLSPTSEATNVDRNLRLNIERKNAHSTTSLELGDSSENLSYTCNTPVDPNCPNSAFPTPPPSMKSNPPYAQLLYDQHWMASLRDVVANDAQRLVYGIDLMRGIARVDQGTGGGSPLAADNAPIFDAYAQTAAYLQSQWFGRNGNELYAGLRAERDGALGGAYSPSLGGILHLGGAVSLRLNAATAFRAPTAEELYYPGFSNPNLQPERTRVADATLIAPASWGDVRFGWFTTSGSNLIVSPPPAYVPENVGHAVIQGLSLSAGVRTFYGCVATLDVTNVYRAEDLATASRIPGRGPVFAVTLGLRYSAPPNSRFDGFNFAVRTQGPQELPNPFLSTAYSVYQPATFTDVEGYVGYRITPALILALRGFNLGNDRYALYAGFPMPGRSFSVELRGR